MATNSLIEKLFGKVIKINIGIFAALWIVYCIASFFFNILGQGGWSVLLTLPVSFLLFSIICATVLAKLILYRAKTKCLTINFYPVAFGIFLVLPQILFVLFNTVRDCGDNYCDADPNLLAVILGLQTGYSSGSISPLHAPLELISFLITVVSIIAYIAGLGIIFKRTFSSTTGEARENQAISKKIKTWIFIILFNIVLIAGGIGFTMLQFGAFSFACPIIIGQHERDLCYREKAVKNLDLEMCQKISTRYSYRDYCYKKIGAAKHDLAICDMVERNENKEKDSCYGDVAAANNDLSICDMIEYPAQKVYCYKEIGILRNDLAICKKIIVDDYNSEHQQYDCFSGVAEASKDLKICDLIGDQDDKSWCYKNVGVAKQDKAICDLISDSYDRKMCYEGIGLAK